MEYTAHPFTFIVALSAVVNGMGIVRLLSTLSEYIRSRRRLTVRHYWVFNLFAGLQLLLHILFWWSLWSLRDTSGFNFPKYVYFLAGPTLLYLASSLLAPSLDDESVDIRSAYYDGRETFFTVMSLAWLWAIILRPVMEGSLAPTWPVFGLFLASSVVLRISDNPVLHAVLALGQWMLLAIFIGMFGMQLGQLPGAGGVR